MAGQGTRLLVELGAGRVLTSLSKRMLPEAKCIAASTPEEIAAAAELLRIADASHVRSGRARPRWSPERPAASARRSPGRSMPRAQAWRSPDTRAEVLDGLAQELGERGACGAGRSQPRGCRGWADRARRKPPWAGLDILVNNAGITRDNLAMRMKDEEWDEVLGVNLTAAFRLSRAAMRGMMKRRFGRIIGITSVVGVTGNAGQANYAASKAGHDRHDQGAGPGAGQPQHHGQLRRAGLHRDGDDRRARRKAARAAILATVPAGRLGTAEEVAAAVVYLASARPSYITGQTSM